jgi:purine-nucleoside phosphorylase
MEHFEANIEAAYRAIAHHFKPYWNANTTRTALILGSGLGESIAALRTLGELSYQQIDGFPRLTSAKVIGHAGNLKLCALPSKKIVEELDSLECCWVMQGRFHYYEGYSMEEVTTPVRVLHRLGVKTLMVTNASGGISSGCKAGTIMLMTDHLNLMGVNPLRGKNLESFGSRFPDMTQAYDADLQKLVLKTAKKIKLPLKRGVYAAVAGPSYETRAEVQMLKRLGADAVGMSTVPEVIVARHQGMRVLGFSMIANAAAGLAKGERILSHQEVVETCQRTAGKLGKLLLNFLPALESLGRKK